MRQGGVSGELSPASVYVSFRRRVRGNSYSQFGLRGYARRQNEINSGFEGYIQLNIER